MWPAIVIGTAASYFFSKLLNGDDPPPRQAHPGQGMRPQLQGPPPMQIDPHCEPRTRAGVEHLLVGGTPEQLDQAAGSLLRSGYPLAAQLCAMKAVGMRQFAAQQIAAKEHHERMQASQAQALAAYTEQQQAHAAQQQAHAAQLAQQNAQAAHQAQAVADASARMHQLAANKPSVVSPAESGVQPVPVHATVPVVSPPGPALAPPLVQASGGAPLPSAPRAPRAVAAPAAPKKRGRPKKVRVVEPDVNVAETFGGPQESAFARADAEADALEAERAEAVEAVETEQPKLHYPAVQPPGANGRVTPEH